MRKKQYLKCIRFKVVFTFTWCARSSGTHICKTGTNTVADPGVVVWGNWGGGLGPQNVCGAPLNGFPFIKLRPFLVPIEVETEIRILQTRGVQPWSTAGTNAHSQIGPRATAACAKLCVSDNALATHGRLAIPFENRNA